MNAPKTPKPRRRIAGEAKPGEAARPVVPEAPKTSKLARPKLPKRETPSAPPPPPPPSPTADLPAAPPRSDAVIAPRRKLSTAFVTALIVALASVGFGAYGVWHGIDEWRSSSVVEAREAATDAAASATEKIFTYRYNELDEHMRESQATMTPKFAKKFRSISPALNALAPQRKIQVKAVVRHAAAKECGDTCSPQKATVLIFFDQARLSADTDKPTVFGNRVEVFMVQRDDKWLVDDIKAL